MGDDLRTYSRADLEHAAMLVAGATSAVFMQLDPELVMPDQDVLAAVRDGLRGFDEERGSALGYSAEQLSGTRSSADTEAIADGPAQSIAVSRSEPENTHGNRGHGHVFRRPDGAKARCGGPGICAECSRDQAAVAKYSEEVERERSHASPAGLRRAANDGQGAH